MSLLLESVDEIFKCNNSNKIYGACLFKVIVSKQHLVTCVLVGWLGGKIDSVTLRYFDFVLFCESAKSEWCNRGDECWRLCFRWRRKRSDFFFGLKPERKKVRIVVLEDIFLLDSSTFTNWGKSVVSTLDQQYNTCNLFSLQPLQSADFKSFRFHRNCAHDISTNTRAAGKLETERKILISFCNFWGTNSTS